MLDFPQFVWNLQKKKKQPKKIMLSFTGLQLCSRVLRLAWLDFWGKNSLLAVSTMHVMTNQNKYGGAHEKNSNFLTGGNPNIIQGFSHFSFLSRNTFNLQYFNHRDSGFEAMCDLLPWLEEGYKYQGFTEKHWWQWFTYLITQNKEYVTFKTSGRMVFRKINYIN